MEMEPELKEVCEKLDQVLDGIMNTLSEILVCQNELEEIMKNGFLMLSKARYNIGLNRISSTQYNEDGLEEASTKVMMTEGKESQVTFSLQQQKDELDNVANSSLRHRRQQKEDTSPEDLIDDIGSLNISSKTDNNSESSEVMATKQNTRTRDPLNWFGVLVPQALRNSQNHFRKAIEQCCHLATLKVHILKLRREHDLLMSRKEELKLANNSSSDAEELLDDESD